MEFARKTDLDNLDFMLPDSDKIKEYIHSYICTSRLTDSQKITPILHKFDQLSHHSYHQQFQKTPNIISYIPDFSNEAYDFNIQKELEKPESEIVALEVEEKLLENELSIFIEEESIKENEKEIFFPEETEEETSEDTLIHKVLTKFLEIIKILNISRLESHDIASLKEDYSKYKKGVFPTDTHTIKTLKMFIRYLLK